MSITLVQHNFGVDGTSADSSTVALTGSAVASGNLVVGAVQFGGTSNISTVTDDKGNTYNIADNVNDTTDSQRQVTFWLNNVTNGPSTITATFTTGLTAFRRILWDEFSGVSTGGSPTDGHTEQFVAGSLTVNAMTSGAITTTVDGDLIWAAGTDGQGAGATWSAGTGFTLIDRGLSTDNDNMICEWLVQSTHGSIAGTFSESGTASNGVVGVIAFKAAGAAPAFIPFNPWPQAGPILAT